MTFAEARTTKFSLVATKAKIRCYPTISNKVWYPLSQPSREQLEAMNDHDFWQHADSIGWSDELAASLSEASQDSDH